MELVDCFNVNQSVPHVHDASEFETVLQNFSNNKQVIQEAASAIEEQHSVDGVSIKNLLFAIELSI